MGEGFSKIGIGWQIAVPSGWGTYGTNLTVTLAARGIEPVLFLLASKLRVTQAQIDLLRPLVARQKEWYDAAQRGGLVVDFPLLHPMGDGLKFHDILNGLRGRPNVAIPFFESAVIPPENIEAAKQFALIIAGSSWNAEVLARHNVKIPVRTCLQGVDLELFTPGPKAGHFGDRFVVFSGGKLEYRKGQDLVVAAFKRFHAKYPQALLVTAWHSPWPQLAGGLKNSPHVVTTAGVKADGTLDVGSWLLANGLPPAAFHDMGPIPNPATPQVLREVDLAVFPNRSEGGTNLVAMECMACGVPVALARNTGHLDLIKPDNCYSLDMQIPIGQVTNRPDMEGWGETSVDELVATMERAYHDRADAKRRGAAGAAFMQDWGWPAQVDRLLAALNELKSV
jgi:glycosyltransferase involved in cell wall biosynthesis